MKSVVLIINKPKLLKAEYTKVYNHLWLGNKIMAWDITGKNKLKKAIIGVKDFKDKVTIVKTKAIMSGNIIEYYEYQTPTIRGLVRKKSDMFIRKGIYMRRRKKDIVNSPNMSISAILKRKAIWHFENLKKYVPPKKIRRDWNIAQTKNKIRRLINTNATNSDSFITFTFAENITDFEIANKKWTDFIREWNRLRKLKNLAKLKYLTVIEFQDGTHKYIDCNGLENFGTGRGAIHFHCIFFNIEFVPVLWLHDLWGNGTIQMNKIKGIDNIGVYVTSYLNKQNIDERLNGKKVYQCSRGLIKPTEIINSPLTAYLNNKVVYETTFVNKYDDTMITYKQLNLNDLNKFRK